MSEEMINRNSITKIIDLYLKQKDFTNAFNLIKNWKVSGYLMTKTRLKREYGINEWELERFNKVEVNNPHYENAPKMKLYLVAEVENYLKQ